MPSLVSAAQVEEDFTTFTEYDANNRFSIDNSTLLQIIGLDEADDNHNVIKDYTSGYWQDFTHTFRFLVDNATDSVTPGRAGAVWGLANARNDLAGIDSDNDEAFFLEIYQNATNLKFSLYLQQYTGNKNDYVTGLDEDTWYYIMITRTSTNLYCGIYSTAVLRDAGDGTDGDIDNLAIASCLTTRFRYLYIANSYGGGGGGEDMYTLVMDLEINTYTYEYTLQGLYDETDGTRDGAVSVTVHFSGLSSESISVDGTYIYTEDTKPEYFVFDLVDNDREYWLDTTENTGTTIHIFNASTTVYTITFIDLSGVLGTYSFVSARRQVNATTYTIEKRQADSNNKVVMSLISGSYYDLRIEDSTTVDYGREYFGSDVTVEIVLSGMEFPPTIVEGYKYVRIWAYRDADDASILRVNYEDLQTETNNVSITYYYIDGTSAYETYSTSDSFISSWSTADENTTYYVVAEIDRDTGPMEYRQVLARTWGRTNPWSLDFLWPSAPFSTDILIPALIVLCVAGVFSSLNVPIGALAAVATSIVLWWIWGLSIPEEALLIALVMALLLGFQYAKRRVQVL